MLFDDLNVSRTKIIKRKRDYMETKRALYIVMYAICQSPVNDKPSREGRNKSRQLQYVSTKK